MRAKTVAMTDELPDRLSVNPKSPYFNEALLKHGIGVRLNGEERTNVEEYCISEGWIRVPAGKAVDRKGNPMTLMIRGRLKSGLKKTDQASLIFRDVLAFAHPPSSALLTLPP